MAPPATPQGIGDIFSSGRGIHMAIDLAGLAIAGGLFIVPTFSAVQAWAGTDRRARVVAGVNVLNAAFMTFSALAVALLQKFGMTTAELFVLLGGGSLLVAGLIGKTMPASALSDALSIIYRALFRIEVKGLENLHNAGPNVIIALNHVSFLDAGARDVATQPQAGVRDRRRHLADVVGKAVPQAHARIAARSDEADGDAHADQRGEGRRGTDHLPGGPHHRHRQPDEGL